MGLWFGYQSLFLPGALALLLAGVIFIVSFTLDGRTTEVERRHRWESARAHGMVRYLVRSIIGASTRQLPLIAFYLVFIFRTWRVGLLIIVLMLLGSVVIPIVLWLVNERHYRRFLEKTGSTNSTLRAESP